MMSPTASLALVNDQLASFDILALTPVFENARLVY